MATGPIMITSHSRIGSDLVVRSVISNRPISLSFKVALAKPIYI